MSETHAEKPDERTPRKREKRDVHGWLVLDKPIGMTSTHAVSVVKRAFQAKRAGHAGTLDPLASGCLPIALGEATKTVPFRSASTPKPKRSRSVPPAIFPRISRRAARWSGVCLRTWLCFQLRPPSRLRANAPG